MRYVEERFGIPREAFKDFSFVASRDVWIASREAARCDPPALRRKGIRFARIFDRAVKLTTAAIQMFGHLATRNVIVLEPSQVPSYLSGQDIAIGQIEGIEPGQVIVRTSGDVLGSGLYAKGKLKNQLPKGRRVVG